MCAECQRLKDVLLAVRGLLPPRVCPVAVAYIDRALDEIPGLPSPEQSKDAMKNPQCNAGGCGHGNCCPNESEFVNTACGRKSPYFSCREHRSNDADGRPLGRPIDAGKVAEFVRHELWKALNVSGYSAQGELVQAPKKVCEMVNRIGMAWIASLK